MDRVEQLKQIHDHSLTKNQITLVEDEKLEDTLLDLHNYSAMALMLLKN